MPLLVTATHILSYGSLVGLSVYHSFISGPILLKALERPQFSVASAALFPIYFSLQTALPAVVALTYPASRIAGVPASIAGVFHPDNRWSVLFPLTVACTTAFTNLVWLLPASLACLEKRRAQERKDGKKSYDPRPHSEEMLALNKQFGKLHGLQMLLNLGSIIASVSYSFSLASRLS